MDYLDEIARLGIATQTYSVKGGWYSHPAFPEDAKGERKVQGVNAIKDLVRKDEKLREVLTKEIVAKARHHAGSVAPMTNNEAELDPDAISPFLLSGGVVE